MLRMILAASSLAALMVAPALAEDGAHSLGRQGPRAEDPRVDPAPRVPGSRAIYERDPASAPFTRGWTSGPSEAEADDRPRRRIQPNIDIVIDPTRDADDPSRRTPARPR